MTSASPSASWREWHGADDLGDEKEWGQRAWGGGRGSTLGVMEERGGTRVEEETLGGLLYCDV